MGCQQSARLAFELQTARTEVEELQKTLKLEESMKAAFQVETEKAKSVVLTLTAENEKLAYELHIRKNSDYAGTSGVFESTKEEFQKMKQWTEMEIHRANDILGSLLASSPLTEKDDKHHQIMRIMEDIQDSEYDPEKLIELGQMRFDFIQDFVTELMEFRSKTVIQLKALEATFKSAIDKCPVAAGKDLLASLVQAPVSSKITIMRDIVKKVGLANASGGGLDDETQRLLVLEAEELQAQASIDADTIAFLRSARSGMVTMEKLQAELKSCTDMLASAKEQVDDANALKQRFAQLQEDNAALQTQLKAMEEAAALGPDADKAKDPTNAQTENEVAVHRELSLVKEKMGALEERLRQVTLQAKAVQVDQGPENVHSLLSALEEFATMWREEGVLRQFSFTET